MVYDSINQSKAMSRSFYLLAAREKLPRYLLIVLFQPRPYFLTTIILDAKHEKMVGNNNGVLLPKLF